MAWSYSVSAMTVLPVDLDQMISWADRIFMGTCLSVQQDSIRIGQNTLPATVYTFEVSKPLKGRFSRQVTFKQIGLGREKVNLFLRQSSTSGKVVQVPLHIPGIPEYQPGDEVLLFLTVESSVGLVSPVGLFQGAFFARKDKASGLKLLSNSIQNVGLISGHQGPLSLDDLLAQIRAHLNK